MKVCGAFSVGVQPEDGKDGQDSVVYEIRPFVTTVPHDANGQPKIESFEVSLYRITGNNPAELFGDYYWNYSVVFENGRTSVPVGPVVPSATLTVKTSANAKFYQIQVTDSRMAGRKTIAELTLSVTKDGDPGHDSVLYDIKGSADSIALDGDGRMKISNFTLSLYKTVGNKLPQLCFDYYCICRYYNKNGTMDAQLSPSGKVSGIEIIQGYININSVYVTVGFGSVRGQSDIAQKTFQIVRDGQDSSIPGPAGKPGPLFYPAGVWNYNTSYTRTADLCPFVYYSVDNSDDGSYYIPREEGTISPGAVDPVTDGGDIWQEIRNIEYIFTKFIMANHALLAGFVAYNNQLYSQRGTISGVSSNNYRHTNFIPNLLLDGLLGKISAKLGEIGNFSLKDGSLSAVDGTTEKLLFTTKKIGDFSSLSSASTVTIVKQTTFPVQAALREGTYQYSAYMNVTESCTLEFNYDISYRCESGGVRIELDCTVMDYDDRVFGSFSGLKNSISLYVPRDGRYYLYFTVKVTSTNNYEPLIGEWNFAIDSYAKKIIGVKKTIIGLDGIYSYWNATRYMYLSESDPDYFFRLKGNAYLTSPNNQYGIRVTDTGLEKTEDGGRTWTKI